MAFSRIPTFLLSATVTLFAALGASLAPAHAAIMDFSFTTKEQSGNAGHGSFKMDTSVLDTNPALNFGNYSNVISALQYDNTNYTTPVDLSTIRTLVGTQFHFASNPFFDLTLNLTNSQLINNLTTAPLDYQMVAGNGGRVVFGPLIGAPCTTTTCPPQPVAQIVSIQVTPEIGQPTPVSEPSATASMLAVGALGGVSLLRRQKKGGW